MKNRNTAIMLLKSIGILVAVVFAGIPCFGQVHDTIAITDNEQIIVTSKKTAGNIPVNFILFDAQYLSESFLSTIEYWSFFEDIQLDYKVVRIIQNNRSKYQDADYIRYLYEKISQVIDSRKGFNILVSHSAGSFFSFNLLNEHLPVDACILVSPALNDYPVENVHLNGLDKVYISSSRKDSFGHDHYFKTLKKHSDTKHGDMKFEMFRDLSHITLFQPSVYNGLSHLFHVFTDFRADYGKLEFLPKNFHRLVSEMYHSDQIVLSDEHYFFHFLEAKDKYTLEEQLAYIDQYLEMEPTSINFLFAKGDLFYKKKLYPQALKTYEKGYEECKKQQVWNLNDFENKITRTKERLK